MRKEKRRAHADPCGRPSTPGSEPACRFASPTRRLARTPTRSVPEISDDYVLEAPVATSTLEDLFDQAATRPGIPFEKEHVERLHKLKSEDRPAFEDVIGRFVRTPGAASPRSRR